MRIAAAQHDIETVVLADAAEVRATRDRLRFLADRAG